MLSFLCYFNALHFAKTVLYLPLRLAVLRTGFLFLHVLPKIPRLIFFTTVAPATGTPETGGWSTRELRTIIRGLEGINFVAADIVEVAPAYDTNAEHTTMAAADTLYEVMTLMVKKGPLSAMVEQDEEVQKKGIES